MSVTVERRGPGMAQIRRDLERLRKSDVLVGIPQSKTLRKGDTITNAAILYIQSAGSPLRNLPARPVLEPAIEGAKSLIAPQLAAASKALLNNRPDLAEKALARAGMIAVNAAKRRIGSKDLAPNAPSTIRQKGSDAPLIDTGALRRSIVSVIRISGKTPVESPASE